jgi:hypothetical protein
MVSIQRLRSYIQVAVEGGRVTTSARPITRLHHFDKLVSELMHAWTTTLANVYISGVHGVCQPLLGRGACQIDLTRDPHAYI